MTLYTKLLRICGKISEENDEIGGLLLATLDKLTKLKNELCDKIG